MHFAKPFLHSLTLFLLRYCLDGRGRGGRSKSRRSRRSIYVNRSDGRTSIILILGGVTIFHGAFIGGHSVGHFNTVGTEGGWPPSSSGYGYDDHDNDEEKRDD